MSKEILIDAIGDIDDTYVQEYAEYKAYMGKRWLPYEVLAVCAVLVLAIGVWVWRTTGSISKPENPNQPDRIQAVRVSESAKPTASEVVQPTNSAENVDEEAQMPAEGAEEQGTDIVEGNVEDGNINSAIVEGNVAGNEETNEKGQQGFGKATGRPGDGTIPSYEPDDSNTSTITKNPISTKEPAQIEWNVVTACNDPYEEWQDMFWKTPEPTLPPTENPPDGEPMDPMEPGPGNSFDPFEIYGDGIVIEYSVQSELGCTQSFRTFKYLKSGEYALMKEWYRTSGNTIYDVQVFTDCSSIEEANRKYPINAFSNVTQISKVHGATVYLTKDSGGMTYSRFLKDSILVTLWGRMSDDEMLKIVDSMIK